MTLEIRPVSNSKEKKDFINLPWSLHAHDANWVPPLKIAVKDLLNTKKHPFYKQAKLQLWNAYRNNKCVGRIAGIINHAHNQFHNDKTGFWGFFECENNVETSRALFQTVEQWIKEHNMDLLRGPMNPSTNYECGLQISAFDTRPFIMMTQNPPYYADLVEQANFSKAKDLHAWIIDQREVDFDRRLLAKAEAAAQEERITFRHINMKRYNEEVANIFAIYNDAWEKNWGFIPMSDDEFRLFAKEMKAIIIPELILIVEVDGEMAGFGALLPDVNQVLAKIRNGRLLPTGLFKLLWHAKVKKSINQGRIPILGVSKKYQSLQLGPLLYMKYLEIGPKHGFPVSECSWILEDNKSMNFGLKLMGAKKYKAYRIYDKELV